MDKKILAIDVGTTNLKMGIFNKSLQIEYFFTQQYNVNIVDREKAEIDPEIWWKTIQKGCHFFDKLLNKVDVVSFSVTTPGLLAMDRNGNPLTKAILFLDQRSHKQSEQIISTLGSKVLLEKAGNLPVSGGSSLSSILWIKENYPKIYYKTFKFGHTNTFLIYKLTGKWAIDPSTTSNTGLYNTKAGDLTWNYDFMESLSLSEEKFPNLYQSYSAVGYIDATVADLLGLPKTCKVLCGGNDAVLSAFSAEINKPGDVLHISGTCDIMMVCLDRMIGSPIYNIRSHILPGLWLTLFVLNTGGKSIEWFHSVFCSEMSDDTFYNNYIPNVINKELHSEPPNYVPFLNGSRYSTKILKASFSDVDINTTRDSFLISVLKGNNQYMASHLKEISKYVKLNNTIKLTGGAASVKSMDQVKLKWLGKYDYKYVDQSSLHGAAKLGGLYFKNL